MNIYRLLPLALLIFSSCGQMGEKKIVGERKVTGIEPLKIYHVDTTCELHEKSAQEALELRQLIIKTKYKWEDIGAHTDKAARKRISFPINSKKSVSADRNLILGGKSFKSGAILNEMIHWQGGPDGTGFRFKEETLTNSNLTDRPTNFTLQLFTNGGVKFEESIKLTFDSTIVKKVLDPKGVPCD